jgi:transposase-like protein
VTFEEGTCAAWLHDLLKPHVSRLVVCDPRKNALLKDGSKSDQIDARKLAELLRGNQLSSVYHGDHGLRTLKELGRSYLTITKDLTRVMSRIKALYRKRTSMNVDGRLDIFLNESHSREVGTSDRCPLGAEMDTSQQVAVIPRNKEVSVGSLRQRRSIAEKRRIVEETLAPGASVARVARAHGVNANQVFGWRRLYLAGRLGEPKLGMKLLAVRVSESKSAPVGVEPVESHLAHVAQPQRSTIHLELRQAKIRIEGSADPTLVRVLLEFLRT